MHVQAKLHVFYSKHFTTRTVALPPMQLSYKTVVLLAAALAIAGLVYIWQINALAVAGYQVKELETRLHELTTLTEQMQVQISQEQSTEKILERIKTTSLVPAAHISHITIKENDVAYAR